MSLLASEPAAPIRSLAELLAIAYSLEREAAEYYARFAVQIRQEGLVELAELFDKLALEERHHEQYVEMWSMQRLGRTPDPAALRWVPPETFDLATGAELASSRLTTAYRILAAAVQNEDRAFALWSYIAAHAEEDELRAAAEAMARTELQHAWQLRRARRKAYHAEGRREADLTLSRLGADEFRLAELLDRAAENSTSKSEFQRLAHEARDLAGSLASPHDHKAESEDRSIDILALAERLTEDYLEMADRSGDEGDVGRAQALAERAVLRLARIRVLTDGGPGGEGSGSMSQPG